MELGTGHIFNPMLGSFPVNLAVHSLAVKLWIRNQQAVRHAANFQKYSMKRSTLSVDIRCDAGCRVYFQTNTL